MDNLRRVHVQLSSKVDMNTVPLRPGIFDLLQKIHTGKGAEPITSNLPSENISIGIGSKRIAGTGRTAGILLKKQQKQGIVSADGQHLGGPGGGRRKNDEDELTFLKNAIGQEIGFELEKGGGARANLLATKGRIRNKLVDAAAMKVGVDLGLVARVVIVERERQKRKREEKKKEEEEGGKKKKKANQELYFLQDSLGMGGAELSKEEKEKRRLGYLEGGGGARANLLATKGRIRNKLVDAAAMKVGVDLGLVARVVIVERERQKRKREEKKKEEEEGGKKKKKANQELYFLQDSLGMGGAELSKEEKEKRRLGYLEGDDDSEKEEKRPRESYYVSDETDELRNLPEEERRAAFQAQYKAEVARQKKLLGIPDEQAQYKIGDGLETVAWEDG